MKFKEFKELLINFNLKDFVNYFSSLYRGDIFSLLFALVCFSIIFYLVSYLFKTKSVKFHSIFYTFKTLIVCFAIISGLSAMYITIEWFKNEYDQRSYFWFLSISILTCTFLFIGLINLFNSSKYLDVIHLPFTASKYKNLSQEAKSAFATVKLYLLIPLVSVFLTIILILSTDWIKTKEDVIVFIFDDSSSMSESIDKAKAIIPPYILKLDNSTKIIITSFENDGTPNLYNTKEEAISKLNSLKATNSSPIVNSIKKTYEYVKQEFPTIMEKGGVPLIMTTDGDDGNSGMKFSEIIKEKSFKRVFPPRKSIIIVMGNTGQTLPFVIDAKNSGYNVQSESNYNRIYNYMNGIPNNVYFLVWIIFLCSLLGFFAFLNISPIEKLNT